MRSLDQKATIQSIQPVLLLFLTTTIVNLFRTNVAVVCGIIIIIMGLTAALFLIGSWLTLT